MKIREISRKLNLNKTTIAHLNDARMKKINAGFAVKISGDSICVCNYSSAVTDSPCCIPVAESVETHCCSDITCQICPAPNLDKTA